MCEDCQLLRSARTPPTKTSMPLRQYHAYFVPMEATSPHAVCPGCIVYALLRQNTFLQRWHNIQDTLKPTPPLQQHRFIHSLDPILGTGISCHLGGTSTPPTPSPTPPPRQVIDITLHQHANNKIAAVFAQSTADNSAMVHLFHPRMPLILCHPRRLRITLRPSDNYQLPLRVLYHHLLISARSPLISRDRYLSLIMDNTIHTMTPNDTHDPSTRLHYLRLFLNVSVGSPYLLYTFDSQSTIDPPSLRSEMPPQQVYSVVSRPLSDHDDIA